MSNVNDDEMMMMAFCARGLSQSPVRRYGTHCLIRFVIRPSSLNVLARDLKTHLFAGH